MTDRPPDRALRILLRLGLIVLAYALASIASGLAGTLVMLIKDNLARYPQVFLSTTGLAQDLMTGAAVGSALSAFFALPVGVPAIVISEWWSVSHRLFFACAGLAAGLVGWVWFSANLGVRYWPPISSFAENLYMLPSVIAGGLAGGFTYWLIAGRRAGSFRSGSPAV